MRGVTRLRHAIVLLVCAGLAGGLAVLGWILVVTLAAQLVPENRVLVETVDGGRRLLVMEGSLISLDPVYAVVLRSGSGPFEQESLVYQGLEQMPQPAQVRFVDAGTVEVSMTSGCRYRSAVEAGTLAVEPVHRPLRIDGC